MGGNMLGIGLVKKRSPLCFQIKDHRDKTSKPIPAALHGLNRPGPGRCGSYFLKLTSMSTGAFRWGNTKVWPEKVRGTVGVTFTAAIERFLSCRRHRCI